MTEPMIYLLGETGGEEDAVDMAPWYVVGLVLDEMQSALGHMRTLRKNSGPGELAEMVYYENKLWLFDSSFEDTYINEQAQQVFDREESYVILNELDESVIEHPGEARVDLSKFHISGHHLWWTSYVKHASGEAYTHLLSEGECMQIIDRLQTLRQLGASS